MRGLRDEFGMGMLFITHDLGVVAEIADRVAVMYAGRIVEEGGVEAIFDEPRHPYTRALLQSLPRMDRSGAGHTVKLEAIAGQVPSPLALPPACSFAPRCAFVQPRCTEITPVLEPVSDGHAVRCLRWREIPA
jgi:oligopeptide/dipeptide ABC transporter ATP-binding protein